MNGGYLDMQLRQWIMRPIVAFREYIFSDVLPTFGNLENGGSKSQTNTSTECGRSQPLRI